ncbi:hypothetical protein Avbf_01757 [Armadillidium vulgare]|nr:hypothetical protein Avbf_01757 [Armadillidium vulgare]
MSCFNSNPRLTAWDFTTYRTLERYESDQCFQKLAERTANHVADAGKIEIHQDGSRKQNCLYCMKLVSGIGKHYLKVHYDKVDIKKILSLPVNSEERRRSLKILRLKGNFYHNICVLKRKEGIVIVPKRLQGKGSPYKPKDYIPCINCLGFYYKKDARRHFAICNVSENQPKATIKKGYQLLYTHIYEFEKDVSDFFSGMNDDDVTAAARQDNLITSFVESMVNQRKNIRDNRQQVRLLSRFLLKLREEHGEANDLKSFIDPTNFDNLVRTAKYMSYTQDKPCNPVTFAIHIGPGVGQMLYNAKY